jgi:hypothetical protein
MSWETKHLLAATKIFESKRYAYCLNSTFGSNKVSICSFKVLHEVCSHELFIAGEIGMKGSGAFNHLLMRGFFEGDGIGAMHLVSQLGS